MTDHTQTATERFIAKACEAGYSLRLAGDVWYTRGSMDAEALLDPALWEAAGRSLGWMNRKAFFITTSLLKPKVGKEEKTTWNYEWQIRWHGLLDHLAAHPGDVDGYLAGLLDDDPLPHQEPCNCRDCSLTDTKDSK